jgi:hypothetical protein
MIRTRTFLAVAVAGLLLAAGCSSANTSNDSTASSGGEKAAAGTADQAAPPAPQAPGSDAQTNAKAPVFDRAIIYTGQITVRVDHVDASADRIRSLATASGGFVASEKSASGTGSQDQSIITIRIPADKFGDILNEIGKTIGKELDRNISTEDVTEQVADLDAQITATRTSVESVQRLLAQAKDLNQILLLEKELSTRQATLDSLVGKKKRLDDQVALSTVTVTLLGPEVQYIEPKQEEPGFWGGLRSGWASFVTLLRVGALVVGFLLPFVAAAAVVGVPLMWWWRRKRRAAISPAE